MFPNSNKEIADIIAAEVLGCFKIPFAFTEYFDDQDHFIPPPNFWTDTYIIGFTCKFAALLLAMDFNGEAMSHEKRKEIVLLYMSQICGNARQKVMQTAGQGQDQDLEFARGIRDAELVYGIVSGRLNLNDPDPFLQEIRELAKNMRKKEGLRGALAVSDSIEGSIRDSIGGAAMVLTIHTHIKANYLG